MTNEVAKVRRAALRSAQDRWFILGICWALAGCGGGAGATKTPDGAVASDGDPTAGSDTTVATDGQADAAVAMTTETIGPAGGTVALSTGASVAIPASSLSAPTTIGVATMQAGVAVTGQPLPVLPATLKPTGDFVALTPHGQAFSVPVTIRIPFDGALASRAAAAGRPLKLYTAAPNGVWTAVEGAQVSGQAVEATVGHFSYFIVGYEAPGQTFPDVQGRKLDLLFMVDNSQSMQPLQQLLLTNFPVLMQVLKNLPGGLPDIHIGVVSSTMGAGSVIDVPQCAPGGDRGVLQATPRIIGCQPPRDAYIAAGENEITKNYDGTIEDTFSCIAALGDQGCGFEHQLESVAVALGARGAAPVENAGFLRADAVLGIVLITNEDDCSAPADSQLFTTTSTLTADPLGPLFSYRCNEFGHRCAGGATPPRRSPDGNPVTLTDCHSAEDGTLNRIGDYVQLFKGLKADPSQVFLAAITGPVTPYVVEWVVATALPDPEPQPRIAHSCTAANGEYADPPSRIGDLVAAFGGNGSLSSICEPSFAPALTQIGVSLGQRIGPRCLQDAVVAPAVAPGGSGALAQGCAVFESVPTGGGTRAEQAIPACGAGTAGAAPPCFTVAANPACSSGGELTITRTGPVPVGAILVVRCG